MSQRKPNRKQKARRRSHRPRPPRWDGRRPIVLVGLMGCGKTTIGRLLAQRLDIPFKDADHEIERAADRTVAEIFADFGEEAFRDGERKVIARLLEEGPSVIATGGGAFTDAETQARVLAQGYPVWLRAPVKVLVARTAKKRESRPLLNGAEKPEVVLQRLLTAREPHYRKAVAWIDSNHSQQDDSVNAVLKALQVKTGNTGGKAAGTGADSLPGSSDPAVAVPLPEPAPPPAPDQETL